MQKTAYGVFSQPGRYLIKIILIMKITAILLTVGCLHAGANGFSQKISLSLKNTPLVQVFQKIETQTGYGFIYAKEQVGKMKPIDLHVVNAELFSVLEMVFKNQLFTYTISSGNIIIKERPGRKVEQEPGGPAPPFTVTG